MDGNRAPSVITYFHQEDPGDILVQSVYVPANLCTKYTYYCCLNWNMGRPGGGYCGIQCHPDGNCFIFSLWDPPEGKTNGNSIKPVFKSDGKSFTERFGGEGEGLKYMNFEDKWEMDQWYTFVVRRWSFNESTYFGLWVHDHGKKKWIRMVTMDFPMPNIYFENPIACFVEDWHGNGENERGAKFKDTFKRTKDDVWKYFNTGSFYVNQEDACKNWNDCHRIESVGGSCISMQTGGTTKPISKCTRGDINLHSDCVQPSVPPVSFKITDTASSVKWETDDSSTPQFAFEVKVAEQGVASKIDPSCRQLNIERAKGQNIQLIIQDILGREVKEEII